MFIRSRTGPSRLSSEHDTHVPGRDSTRPGREGAPGAPWAVITTAPSIGAERRAQGTGPSGPAPFLNPPANYPTHFTANEGSMDIGDRRQRHAMGSSPVLFLRFLPFR